MNIIVGVVIIAITTVAVICGSPERSVCTGTKSSTSRTRDLVRMTSGPLNVPT